VGKNFIKLQDSSRIWIISLRLSKLKTFVRTETRRFIDHNTRNQSTHRVSAFLPLNHNFTQGISLLLAIPGNTRQNSHLPTSLYTTTMRLQPSAITDALFGTRSNTEGAYYQLPRKIPLRIEPKTYFANERTFLAWLSMATTLGTVGTAIAGYAVDKDTPTKHPTISTGTVQLMTMLMLPLSILMIAYALFTFYWRSEFIRRKQVGFFDDKVGPLSVALLVMVSLIIIYLSALRDVVFRR